MWASSLLTLYTVKAVNDTQGLWTLNSYTVFTLCWLIKPFKIDSFTLLSFIDLINRDQNISAAGDVENVVIVPDCIPQQAKVSFHRLHEFDNSFISLVSRLFVELIYLLLSVPSCWIYLCVLQSHTMQWIINSVSKTTWTKTEILWNKCVVLSTYQEVLNHKAQTCGSICFHCCIVSTHLDQIRTVDALSKRTGPSVLFSLLLTVDNASAVPWLLMGHRPDAFFVKDQQAPSWWQLKVCLSKLKLCQMIKKFKKRCKDVVFICIN